MPLGHQDTDLVYDKLIAPLLYVRNIRPVRIDRLEFNDDIDDKILSELQRCDCAIADLTYARPSVYFEAGFAQRTIPVIYTCRNDHLSPTSNDQFGNFRVHFDLQMKNIIPWRSHSDQQFFKKLGKRIDHTFGPLLRIKEDEKATHEETQKFLAQSLKRKTERIVKTAVTCVERVGYKEIKSGTEQLSKGSLLSEKVPMYYQWPTEQGFPISLPTGMFEREYTQKTQFKRILSLSPRWLGTRYARGGINAVFIYIASDLTKKRLIDLHDSISAGPLYSISVGKEIKAVKQLQEHFLICIFQRIPIRRIMDSLPSFELNQNTGELTWISKQAVPADEIPGYSEIYALPNKSDKELMFMRNREGFVIQDREGRPCTISGSGIYRYYKNERIGRVKRIPRRVSIHIIDAINSESYFVEKLSTLIAKAKL
jgi:hypothetical protein